MKMIISILIVCGGCLCFESVFAQPSTASAASTASSVPTLASEITSYVGIIGGVLTGVATLLGIPIVRLNQRKTRAEIAKLELEAAALRGALPLEGDGNSRDAQSWRIHVDQSPYTTIKVLADPRFLGPLLLLLDFVFAWVVLTLAGYFLSIFDFGIIRQVALAALALFLLVPIGKQALHVRAVLRPDQRSPEEISTARRQAKNIVFAVYFLGIAAALALGLLLLTSGGGLTTLGYCLGWGLLGLSGLLIVAIPFFRRRIDRYLDRELPQTSSNSQPHSPTESTTVE